MTTGMQSSNTATGVRMNCLYHILMLETNKQASLFNFGKDLSYFVILRYKLRDLIKIYDDFINDPIKGIFRRLCYYFSLLGLSSLIDNQTV